jgi:hypothetical protein
MCSKLHSNRPLRKYIYLFIASSFNPDPTIRNTFWTLTIGGAFTVMFPWTVSQAAVQRFLASKSVKSAQK